MNLTNRQKSLIKKHYKKSTLLHLAQLTGLETSQVSAYLQKQLGEKRFRSIYEESQPAGTSSTTLKTLLITHKNFLLILCVLIFIVYLNALGNEFVSDDLPSIVNNQKLTSFSNINSLKDLGSLPFYLIYRINMVPWLFRGLNILFHLGSAFLVFLIVSIHLQKNRVAEIAAVLFAVHPLLTEAVNWISAMPYTQYTFFFLSSFFSYLRFRTTLSKKYLVYTALFYMGALLTTDKATVLFLIFPLYELSFGSIKQRRKELFVLAILGVLFLGYYLSGLGQRTADLQGSFYQEAGMDNPLIQVPTAIASYLILIFWPIRLSFYHTELSMSTGMFLLYLLIFLGYVSVTIYAFKKNRFLFFWLSFFFVTLLPTLTPLRISWIVAERYVYLGSIGIFVAIGFVYTKLLERENLKKPLYTAGMIVLLLLSVRTMVRNTDWKNHDTLWITTAKTSPSGHVIHNNLGDMYARHNDPAKAIEEFKKATEINPNYADAYHNLANTYQSIQQYDQAIANYQKALSLNPRLWQSYTQLAAIAEHQKDRNKAVEFLTKATELQPDNPQLQQQLESLKKTLRQ